MNDAMATASRATPQPKTRPVRNPSSEVRVKPPVVVVIWDRIAPITAAPIEVPSARMRVLNPLAAAVSDAGTELMIRAGMAP
ncbi:hypothetical protein ASD51_19990 [Streptomyces sp. Root55]|nr:hypothetical protein ASD51_19990 [Streptomyces sp. Root55]